MNNKKNTFNFFNEIKVYIIACLVIIAFFSAITFYFSRNITVLILQGFIFLVFLASFVFISFKNKKQTSIIFEDVLSNISVEDKEILIKFPFPAVYLSNNGRVIWHNDIFMENVLNKRMLDEKTFVNFWKGECKKNALNKNGTEFSYMGKTFQVFAISSATTSNSTLFLMDKTGYKQLEIDLENSQLSILQIVIDNFSEVFYDTKESDKSRVLGQIETVFERFTTKNEAFFRKQEKDRYIVIISEKHIKDLMDEKFKILEEVREIRSPNGTRVTLSIGIGKNGENMVESDKYSRQALEMALGRGGDQVAIKTPDKYTFFGGVFTGVESSSKVKTRIIASALSKIIFECDSCIVMGHKMSDMDSMGSAVGIATAIRKMGRNAYIAIEKEKNQVIEFIKKMEQNGYGDLFLYPKAAMEKLGKNSLLIITDTHVPHMLESQNIYEDADNVVVIDHHRRMVGYIENSVLFFHDPYVSSASEMVAELIPYLENAGSPTSLEAEAMLAGITLDTKNFTFKTGVRTFEAAAYLKRCGADTIAVKKLFATSEETYSKKVAVVGSAKIVDGFAIAVTDITGNDMSLVAPQAADELLTIKGITASFVLYKTSTNKVHISARSYGDVNVQVIMEKLDGGGHLTMAAATLDTSLEEAQKLLQNAIYSSVENMGKPPVLDEEKFIEPENEHQDIGGDIFEMVDIFDDKIFKDNTKNEDNEKQ